MPEPLVPEEVVIDEVTPQSQEDINKLVDETLGLPNTDPIVDEEPIVDDPVVDDPIVDEDPIEDEEPIVEDPVVDETPAIADDELYLEVEDAEGTKFRITKIEDLPEDFVPKNNRQILELVRDTDKLTKEIERRDAERATAEQTAAITAREAEITTAWDAELQALIDAGDIPKPKVDENSPKYAEDPAVVKTDAVFKFMKEENDRRKEAGNPNLLTSFRDAFYLQEREAMKAEKVAADKTESDRAKAKAGNIGGNPSSNTDAPVYKAGSYNSIWDVPIS